MEFIKRNILLFIVFVTGACVLVIEVTALRVLAPYYGNSIYSASSVIGIVLGALSLGYYVGGLRADKYPAKENFYKIILFAGIFTVLIQILSTLLLPYFAYKLTLLSGPFVFSLILFFLPAFVLGMLSPYAIKLHEMANPKRGIGSLSGQIFFASTLGSICGSFSAGFLLIPNFGIDKIITATGILLCFIGFTGLFMLDVKKKIINLGLILFSIVTSVSISLIRLPYPQNVVYQEEGVYSKLVVMDEDYRGRPARHFFQDRNSSSGIYLDTKELAYDYSKLYGIYKFIKPDARNILVLGAGSYTMPNAFAKDNKNLKIDVVDIEPGLFELSKKYFFVEDTGQIQEYVEDGRWFLTNSDKKYDVIFSDVFFSIASVPSQFATKEFFDLSKTKLSDNGIFICNIIGAISDEKPNYLLSQINTFSKSFTNSYFFAVDSPNSKELQNVIFVGINGDKKFRLADFINAESEEFRRLPEKQINIDNLDLDGQIEFVDNYVPLDTLAAKMMLGRLKLGGN